MIVYFYFFIFIIMYTKEDILIKFKEVHGDEYDYSNMIYKNRLTKIEIVCKEHGQFTQTPAAHISGQGCPECAKSKRAKGKRISFEEFISRAKKAHGDKFSYDEKSYSGIESPLKIICSSHGEFTQVGKTHLKSHGCPKCGNDSAFKKLSLSKEDFVEKAIEIHGNKFLYDKVIYSNNRTNVIITCKDHGEFIQKPNYHLLGNGCPSCGGTKKLTNEDFISKSQKVHDNKYDYKLIEYQGNKKKIKIICPTHGAFLQSPSHHMMGSGCPNCNESKGEKLISEILKEKSVTFVRQKRFDECKNKAVLPFDFYLPDYNTCIEFDGDQHFHPWRMKDLEVALLKLSKIQKNDEIKTAFCQANNIQLIRIKFDENINEKLDTFLNGNKQTDTAAN